MSDPDPGGFLRHTVAMFAAKLPPEDLDRARAEVRRLHLDLRGQLHFLADLAEKRWVNPVFVVAAETGTMRDRAREARDRVLGEWEDG